MHATAAASASPPSLVSTLPASCGAAGGHLQYIFGTGLNAWHEDTAIFFKFPNGWMEHCPISSQHSDPNGTHIACRAPDASKKLKDAPSSTRTLTATVVLVAPGGGGHGIPKGTLFNCDGCTIEYKEELTPTASMRYTGLVGSPGDTLAFETENWKVEATTNPPTEALVEGTFGGIHAVQIDQHTSSLRPNQAGLSVESHVLHFKIPDGASAGPHPLDIILDRDGWDAETSQGRVLFHNATSASEAGDLVAAPIVTVVPTITEIHPQRATVGDRLTIIGSGFAHAAADNVVVLPGGHACTPTVTDVHYMVCTVGAAASAAVPSAASIAHPHRGIPLQLLPSSEKTAMLTEACYTQRSSDARTSLAQAAEACHAQSVANGGAGLQEAAAAPQVEHFTVTNEARWPNLHPLKRNDGFREDAFVATSSSTLQVPASGMHTFTISCQHLLHKKLCGFTLGTDADGTMLHVDYNQTEASVMLTANTKYTATAVFSHVAHGEQVEVTVATPSAANSNAASDHKMPIPGEWFQSRSEAAASGNAAVQLAVNNVQSLCRSSLGRSGCSWEYSDASAEHLPHVSEKRLAARHRRSTTPTNNQPRLASQEAEFSSGIQRWRRAIPSGAKRWSALKNTYSGGIPDPLLVPAGETWVVDANLDCGGVIVYGTLMWDIDADDKMLKANYVLVEGNGKFLIGTEDAPMLGKATIYIKDSDAQHPHVGRRFIAGYNGYTPSMTNLDEAAFNEVAKKGAAGPGPEISIYGRPMKRTWTLLSQTIQPGDVEMPLKHSFQDLGWQVGDEIAISYTNGKIGHRSKIAKKAPSVASPLTLTATSASHSEGNADFSRATDGRSNTAWSSFNYQSPNNADAGSSFIEFALDGVKAVHSFKIAWNVAPAKFKVLTRAAAGGDWTYTSSAQDVFAGDQCSNDDDPGNFNYNDHNRQCWSSVFAFPDPVKEIRVEVAEFACTGSAYCRIRMFEAIATGRASGTTLPDVFFLEDPVPEQLLGGYTTYDGEQFEMAGEVMNLERSVKITGDTDGFVDGAKQGLHTMMFGGKMIVDHSRVEYCGQRNVLGRYCLHWHHVGHCPECKFTSNAIVEGQTKGLVIHGTHNALADNNVLWNSRGVGIYTEDGNEMHNTISNNVVSCQDKVICHVAEISAMYVVAFDNNFLNNRVSSYSNGIFFPGAGGGQGNARGRVCTSLSPFGTVKDNVDHDCIRFGFYLDNDFPRRILRDSNGMLADKDSCNKLTPDGRDNGKFTPIEGLFEWKNGATGQYSCGDIQYVRSTFVNQVGQYWKVSKVHANGEFAHIKDSLFVNSHVMGPAGPFTFGIENSRFIGSNGAVSSGQHCGLTGYHYGTHMPLCAVQYVAKNVTWGPNTGNRIKFGDSGGNPVLPTFHSLPGDDSFQLTSQDPSNPNAPAWSIVSGYLNGFQKVQGCKFHERNEGSHKLTYADQGAYACPFKIRRLTIWSPDQGEVRIVGPGYTGVKVNHYFPTFGQNAGFMHYDIAHKAYAIPVVDGETYTIFLKHTADVAIHYSDVVLDDTFGILDTVNLVVKVAGETQFTCTAKSSDCRAFDHAVGWGSCAEKLHEFAPTNPIIKFSRATGSSESAVTYPGGTDGIRACNPGPAPWDRCSHNNAWMALDKVAMPLRMWKPNVNDANPTLTLSMSSKAALDTLLIWWENVGPVPEPKEPDSERPKLTPGTCAALETSLSLAPLDAWDSTVLTKSSAEDCRDQCKASDSCTHFAWQGPTQEASQISTAWGGDAERAIDGNANSNFNGNSCTHTEPGHDNPWWQVDLGAVVNIDTVRVTNRGDGGYGPRLNGFFVYVDDVECASNVQIADGQTLDVDCIGAGQVVRIELHNSNVKNALTVCEVAVLPGTVANGGYEGKCYLGTDGNYNAVRAGGYTSAACEPAATDVVDGDLDHLFDEILVDPEPFDFVIKGRSNSAVSYNTLGTVTRKRGETVTVIDAAKLGNGASLKEIQLNLPKGTAVMEVTAMGARVATSGWDEMGWLEHEGSGAGQWHASSSPAYDEEFCQLKCDEQGDACNVIIFSDSSCWLKKNTLGCFKTQPTRNGNAYKTLFKTAGESTCSAYSGPSSASNSDSGASASCRKGFYMDSSIQKSRGGGGVSYPNCEACGKACLDEDNCDSYECNPKTNMCQKDMSASFDTTGIAAGYNVCVKRLIGAQIAFVAATASHNSQGNQAAEKAIDGDMSTRWSSNGRDKATVPLSFIILELSAPAKVGRVNIAWEFAKAKRLSFFGRKVGETEYTPIVENIACEGFKGNNVWEDFHFTSAESFEMTHLKMVSLEETTGYGTSPWEIRAYASGGIPDVTSTTTTLTTATTVTTTTIFRQPWDQSCPGRWDGKNRQSDDAFWNKDNPNWNKPKKVTLPGALEDQYDNAILITDGYAFYYNVDAEKNEFDAALHCNDCPGWMGIGFPDRSAGNSAGNMVTSHAVVATCNPGQPTNVHEYKLSGYHVSSVNKLGTQSLTETECKVSELGKTVFFKRPKSNAEYTIPAGDPDAGKFIWALGLTDQLAFHGATKIKVAGEGEVVGVEEDVDTSSGAGMGSLYWPVLVMPEGAPPTEAPKILVGTTTKAPDPTQPATTAATTAGAPATLAPLPTTVGAETTPDPDLSNGKESEIVDADGADGGGGGGGDDNVDDTDGEDEPTGTANNNGSSNTEGSVGDSEGDDGAAPEESSSSGVGGIVGGVIGGLLLIGAAAFYIVKKGGKSDAGSNGLRGTNSAPNGKASGAEVVNPVFRLASSDDFWL